MSRRRSRCPGRPGRWRVSVNTYTLSGQVATTTDSLDPAANRSLGYNQLRQLTGLGAQPSAYGYDSAGNLTGLPNGSTLAYDPAGQLQTLTPTSSPASSFGFDQVGDRASGNNVTYGYNQASQLTSSTGPAGAASYSYDGDGLRATSTDTTGTHDFAWDTLTADLPLLLTDGTDDYVYGPNDKVIEQSPVATDDPTFLAQDQIGSTRLITDQSGAVTGTTSYDPYGNVTAHTGTATSTAPSAALTATSTVVANTPEGLALQGASSLTGLSIGQCLGGSAFAGAEASGSLCYYATPSGQGGFTASAGGGGGGPFGFGALIGPSMSNAHNLRDLSGPFGYAWGSFGEGPFSAGLQAQAGENSAGAPIWAVTPGWAPGLYVPVPFSYGGGINNTWVLGKNNK